MEYNCEIDDLSYESLKVHQKHCASFKFRATNMQKAYKESLKRRDEPAVYSEIELEGWMMFSKRRKTY